jgi:predicted small lipoprotein YifL
MTGGGMRHFWLLAIVCALALTACGKKGAPDPPGPQNEITWPKVYPTH